MDKARLGLCLTGSFCTFDKAVKTAYELIKTYDVTPIMSENSLNTDTRFGKAADFKEKLELITGKPVIGSIADAEPIGPKKLFDLLLIAPCTGNTLAKLANGITDSAVTMAAKAHLRNERPLIIAVSTNDGLAAASENIGRLLSRRNVYFVPFGQDDAIKKPRSLVADFDKIGKTLELALESEQIQPILL
ncbi:dipicolinate synthase subunit B [Clostridiaceae bacterium OttesenSCG-928-D20]|nr:dipicolinate synthase subunit B [Clostridiaceae bacterium OttesenSCG-928-D20]